MLTIAPPLPWSTMLRATYLVHRKAEVKELSRTWFHSLNSRSNTVAPRSVVATQFTRISIPPNVPTASSTIVATSNSDATSHRKKWPAPAWSASSDLMVFVPLSLSRSTAPTLAPSVTKHSDIARPTFRPAPVTRARLPLSLLFLSIASGALGGRCVDTNLPSNPGVHNFCQRKQYAGMLDGSDGYGVVVLRHFRNPAVRTF